MAVDHSSNVADDVQNNLIDGHENLPDENAASPEPTSNPKKFDNNGRGKRDVWSLEMYLVLLKHLSHIKGPDNPLRDPKSRLEECERIRAKLRADVAEDQLNDFPASQIRSKINSVPLRLMNNASKKAKLQAYSRDQLYLFGTAVVSLRTLLPKLHLEIRQQEAYDRHNDPFEDAEDFDEAVDSMSAEDSFEEETNDDNVHESAAEHHGAEASVEKEAASLAPIDDEHVDKDEDEDGSEYQDGPVSEEDEGSAIEVGPVHRARALVGTSHVPAPSTKPSSRRSLIVKLPYKGPIGRSPSTSRNEMTPLEHTKQARSRQDEDFHANKRRKLDEHADSPTTDESIAGLRQTSRFGYKRPVELQRTESTPTRATQAVDVVGADARRQLTPGHSLDRTSELAAAQTSNGVDAIKLRLATQGRDSLKHIAPIHAFGDRMETMSKKIIRAVRNRADGSGVTCDQPISTVDINFAKMPKPLDDLFLSLAGMETERGLREVIRADQQDPLRLSELICAITGAAVAEWALIPSAFSSQSQKLLDRVKILLTTQQGAGINLVLQAGTDMILEEARQGYIKEDFESSIAKTARDLRDSLIDILSPWLSSPRPTIDPAVRAALAHAPSSSEGSARPHRDQFVFPKEPWLYTWEAELRDIFAAALKLRADMETAGGNYEFGWPRISDTISVDGVGRDAMILLPMFPRLKAQYQRFYAGGMSELEVVFPGQVFWR